MLLTSVPLWLATPASWIWRLCCGGLCGGSGPLRAVSSGAAHRPNTLHSSGTLGYWKTLDDDTIGNIEILPVIKATAKSYTFKEFTFRRQLGDGVAAAARCEIRIETPKPTQDRAGGGPPLHDSGYQSRLKTPLLDPN